MRVGKRATVVEAKKTRSCVVRLEKVGSGGSPPNRTVRSSTASSRSTQQTEEKHLRGPLKKRPITESTMTTQSSPPATTPRPKDKAKVPPQRTIVKTVVAAAPAYEIPPTIAAGRSRRAIKPNPKYACDDMVTPKIMKNVGALGQTSAAASTQKKSLVSGAVKGERHRSSSSSEDFFNKESSDELDDDFGDLDEIVDKAYQLDEKLNTDSDFSDLEVNTPVLPRKRGRPRKDDSARAAIDNQRTPALGTPTTATHKSAAAPKSTPSQLQQLRKTLSTSVNRLAVVPISGNKRKAETAAAVAEAEKWITTKRMRLLPAGRQQHEPKQLAANLSATTSQGSNGANMTVNPASAKNEIAEKRKILPDKATVSTVLKTSAKATQPASQNSIVLNKSSSGGKLPTTVKPISAAPATPKSTSTSTTTKDVDSSDARKDVAPLISPDDDPEGGMPTFTIVNINDIINKKGDVLISKTGQRPSAVKTMKNDTRAAKADNTTEVTPNSTAPDIKLNKRKAGHTTIVSQQIDNGRLRSPLPRTPFPVKKSTPTLLNKSGATNAAGKGNFLPSSGKPAPRILNSMVAKKTQPVKPMIANLDDSADESFPLSLDDDADEEEDEEEEDEDEDNPEEEDEVEPSESFLGQRKLSANLSTYLSAKKTAPATKENSLAATNHMPPTRTTQRKLSPEKVVISRQGDKIIKKITCFETWYVINIPQSRSPRVIRNLIDIPLIKLANASRDIELPSESWSSKVTLYELSATTLAKSTPITYTGDLTEHNISEEDRGKYQPLCVMFRRAVNDRMQSRLPYDRAVIFKNKTFFTNIEGKNVKLEGAPTVINTQSEVEILLQIVDGLTLQSDLVEPATTMQ